jgi:hypothetical protein
MVVAVAVAADLLPGQAAALQAAALRRTILAALVVMLALAAGPEERERELPRRLLLARQMLMVVAVVAVAPAVQRPIMRGLLAERPAVAVAVAGERPRSPARGVLGRQARSRLHTRRYR